MRELIRIGAQRILNPPLEWIAEIDEATLSVGRALAEDPVLAASTRLANRANLLHWAASNVADPGAPVAPNLGVEQLGIARDLVRRGFGASALEAYRAGQNAAWRRWMDIAFDLTNDPKELHELLDVTAESITSFVDATVSGITRQMETEREVLTRGTHAERREIVALLLEGAPFSVESASKRLAYSLEPTHRAAVVWSERGRSEQDAFEAIAEVLARELGGQRPFTVVASAASLWIWVPSEAEPDLQRLREALRRAPDLRLAIGSKARGIEGFRRSHLQALTAQRIAARLGASSVPTNAAGAAGGPRVVSFDMVRLFALVVDDLPAADELIAHTLGELATAGEELREAVRVFLDEGCNASSAAVRLRTHRNTMLRRLERAEQLLPRPLAENRLHVGVALDPAALAILVSAPLGRPQVLARSSTKR